MSRLTVGSIEGLTENSNVISVPTGHKLNVTDAAGLQIGNSAIGQAVAFTPSWTNFTPGNAVETWHYVRLNDCVFFAGATVLGSTSAVTGSFRFAIPVGSQLSVDVAHVGSGYLNQGGNYVLSQIDVLAGNVRWLTSTAGGTYVGIQPPSATLPWTWASGDTIRGSGMVFIS